MNTFFSVLKGEMLEIHLFTCRFLLRFSLMLLFQQTEEAYLVHILSLHFSGERFSDLDL